jgi:hypothetical protein
MVQLNPVKLVFKCDSLVPMGMDFVREVDEKSCIVVTNLFLFRSGSDVFGSMDFSSREAFYQFKNAQCKCCEDKVGCSLLFNGCILNYNGCHIAV